MALFSLIVSVLVILVFVFGNVSAQPIDNEIQTYKDFMDTFNSMRCGEPVMVLNNWTEFGATRMRHQEFDPPMVPVRRCEGYTKPGYTCVPVKTEKINRSLRILSYDRMNGCLDEKYKTVEVIEHVSCQEQPKKGRIPMKNIFEGKPVCKK